MTTTLKSLLAPHDENARAIGAPGRTWLTYGGLRALAIDVAAQLRAAGIGGSDRVAIVLPNGPEMATAFVTIAQAAITAPLNPAYRQEEFEFYLDDLKAKALVVAEAYDGPALAAAEKFGMTIMRLSSPSDAPAGQFSLTGGGGAPAPAAEAGPDDVALILHTSGTTSRPKIVPLLHSNVAASAQNIKTTLALTPGDRCLNVMPLFHIHGLIAAVSASLADTFSAPVIEAYGMTEAAHQMASNPLPPRAQKPGFVGVAAGPLVRIAHEEDDLLIDGIGEVVISGSNVTPGYEGNPDANAKSFFMADGRRWFRTGDKGGLDEDGYLQLTGRLKEIINRGGEKISPLEVDGILMDHPAVAQVVTFALPHLKLGEEVAAAVVLREGQLATEREIREFAATRLADFKVPRKIVILDEIPKGATGKLQRIGLAEKLGLTNPA